MNEATSKARMIELLRAHVAQRSGINGADYGGSREAFMGDYNRILRDGRDARRLIRAVELSSLSAEVLREGFRTYSGRLALEEKDGTARLSYCTGQYFPTEYRAAACAVCASALWSHYRDDFAKAARPGESAGDAIRRKFRKLYGRGIAGRWFN